MKSSDWVTRPGKDLNNQGHWNTKWLGEGKDTWRQYPLLFGKVIEEIEPRSKLIDLGCGNGVFLGRLQKEREGMELMGLDISSIAIQQLKEFHGIDGIVSRLPEIPYPIPPNHFDYVTMLDVLEHILDEREMMNMAFRVLRPGGVAIVAVPFDHSDQYKEFIRTRDSEHVRWYDEAGVARALSYYGKDPRITVLHNANPDDGLCHNGKYYLGRSIKR